MLSYVTILFSSTVAFSNESTAQLHITSCLFYTCFLNLNPSHSCGSPLLSSPPFSFSFSNVGNLSYIVNKESSQYATPTLGYSNFICISFLCNIIQLFIKYAIIDLIIDICVHTHIMKFYIVCKAFYT